MLPLDGSKPYITPYNAASRRTLSNALPPHVIHTLWDEMQSPHSDPTYCLNALQTDTIGRSPNQHQTSLSSTSNGFVPCHTALVCATPRASSPRSSIPLHRPDVCYTTLRLRPTPPDTSPLITPRSSVPHCIPQYRTALLGSAPHSLVPHITPRHRTALS
jgi:hypothetical protein